MMLFTIIYFFRIFALVLFFSIIQAVIGSFVVFLVFTDCVGPSNPTYLYSKFFASAKESTDENFESRTVKNMHVKPVIPSKTSTMQPKERVPESSSTTEGSSKAEDMQSTHGSESSLSSGHSFIIIGFSEVEC